MNERRGSRPENGDGGPNEHCALLHAWPKHAHASHGHGAQRRNYRAASFTVLGVGSGAVSDLRNVMTLARSSGFSRKNFCADAAP